MLTKIVKRTSPVLLNPAASQFSHSFDFDRELTKHRTKYNLYGLQPCVGNNFIAPNATVTGEVFLGKLS